MKKTVLFFALVLVVSVLKAQNAAPKPKSQYAFVYTNIKTDTLLIYYGGDTNIPVCRMTFTNMNKGIGNSYHKITEGFDRYVQAFDKLEQEGYEFMGTGNYLYGEFNVPYYMFRKKKE